MQRLGESEAPFHWKDEEVKGLYEKTFSTHVPFATQWKPSVPVVRLRTGGIEENGLLSVALRRRCCGDSKGGDILDISQGSVAQERHSEPGGHAEAKGPGVGSNCKCV